MNLFYEKLNVRLHFKTRPPRINRDMKLTLIIRMEYRISYKLSEFQNLNYFSSYLFFNDI